MKKPTHSNLLAFCALCFSSLSAAYGQLGPPGLVDVGYTSLQARLGAATPTGAGISASQVEARNPDTSYRPDSASFPGHNFAFPSGGSPLASGHATTVGQFFFGTGSLAPNIGTGINVITSYDANTWVQSDGLRTGSAGFLPAVEANDVQNHSWIGSFGTTALDVEAVRRLDFQIQRDDFVATMGLNNGSGTPVPPLLAGSYNGITVGLSSGAHSSGTSTIEGVRTRPDIVVPTTATSWATPTVGGAAALLIETARSTPALANGDHSVVVKAVLLTGASRNEPEFAVAWNHTTTQPLDAVNGAGELDVDRADAIMQAGESDSSTTLTLPANGWDFGTTAAGVDNLYFFDLAGATGSYEVGATVAWNRIVTATDGPGAGVDYLFGSSLANLDLRLFSATGQVLGAEIAASLSTVDNVELIHFANLPLGRYAWQITSDTPTTTYGFAWQSIANPIPEPALASLLALSCGFLARRRR